MTDRFKCTPETPWNPSIASPVEHIKAEEVGDQEDGWPGGDIVRYHCPVCGHSWKSELPQ